MLSFLQRTRVEQPWVEAVEAAEAPEVSISSVSRYSTCYKFSEIKSKKNIDFNSSVCIKIFMVESM
jgi:hypothetical protein